MKSMLPTLRRIALLAAVAALYGCATPATQQAMSVGYGETTAVAPAALKSQFTVRNVTGGKDTNPIWTSQVDSAGFRSALQQSLGVAGYMAPSADRARYAIDADLQQLNQPLVGFTMDVTSVVQYTVEGGGTKKVIPITATGSATVSDAFIGMERLRLANEKSIKENIKAFLQALAQQIEP
jgi:uncharacterized lipoprotein YajG